MYQNDDIDNKVTQLRKGVLELVILSALRQRSHYGYSLIRKLTAAGALDLKEGTIYPILSRLAREGMVQTRWAESSQGPPRKYYVLTEAGVSMFEALSQEFQRLTALVQAAASDSDINPETGQAKTIIIGDQDHD